MADIQFETRFVRAREIKIAYVDEGAGLPVLLLHGYPFDESMWDEQVEALTSAGFRAIAPDLYGFGETEFDGLTVSAMDHMAGDVRGLLDALGISKAVVCGLSMGGYVAFEFVQMFPDRVRALVLAGTRAPADSPAEATARLEQAKMLRSDMFDDLPSLAQALLPKLLAHNTLEHKPNVVRRVTEMIWETFPEGAAAAQCGMAERRDYVADLVQIEVPTLIIVGREDTIRPVADAEFMHDLIPDSRLEIIEDAAHLTNLEQPQVFNRVLLSFLNELNH